MLRYSLPLTESVQSSVFIPSLHRATSRSPSGLSLLEVLMTLTVMSVTLLMTFVILQDLSQNSKFSYTQSSRNMEMQSLLDQLDIENPNISSAYDTGYSTPLRSFVESGTNVGYVRTVPDSSCDALSKRIRLWLFHDDQDKTTEWVSKISTDWYQPEVRIDSGNTSVSNYFRDTSGVYWSRDVSYNNGAGVPGYNTVDPTTTGTVATVITNISNTAGNSFYNNTNQSLYQSYRQGNPNIQYSFGVPDGEYIVQLYFAELDNTVNSTTNTRRADIQIENITKLTNYSPFESVGYAKAQVLTFNDVEVADGDLDVEINKAAGGSTLNPRLAAIVIRERTVW